MYNYIINLISKECKKNEGLIPQKKLDEIYLYLTFILYLSTKKEEKATIKKLLEPADLTEFYNYILKNYKVRNYYVKYLNLKSLLKIIKNLNYKDLIADFLQEKKDIENQRLEIFKSPKDKVLYINTEELFSNYIKDNKNGDYMIETLDSKYSLSYAYFQILDKMLGKNINYYQKYNEINIDDYDVIIINDTDPYYKYSANKENLIKEIDNKFYYKNIYKGKIILKTNYNKISHFKYPYLIKCHLSKVLLHENVKDITVYMEFTYDNKDSISLILLNDILANDNTKLQKIIESNRSKKGTLIKVTPEDIKKNNYRISFKMYQSENIAKVKEINDIVDENTYLTKKLEELNETIEAEVNKLLERKGA